MAGGIYVVNNDTTSVSNLTIRNLTISGNQVDAGNGGGTTSSILPARVSTAT